MTSRAKVLFPWLTRRPDRLIEHYRIVRMANQIARQDSDSGQKTVVFFNASTRLTGLSLNAAFSLLTSWAVRLSGVPVVHFVCNAGMSRCVLGTDPDHPDQDPPCKICVRQSRFHTLRARARFFGYQRDDALAGKLQSLSVDELMQVTHEEIPLGALVLPSLRWRMRVHNLRDDEPTRRMYREFILSAWNVAHEFSRLLDETNPQAVVLFNGQFFPEAVARFLARRSKIRAVTHEVGLQPFSAYFTEGEATAYPIHIPETFELDAAQNARLDAYLEKRFQGKFSMAGIQFWPEMKGLDEALLKKADGFRQIVPVFTNVIFDTSQPHSNVVFPDMFTWLDTVLKTIKRHPETLFVIRAHPDESRPGKTARETVAGWAEQIRLTDLPNAVFIPPDEFLSSYELIQRSKFVMIYNSTIGLEAAIIGAPVLCAGKARFTQYPIVFFPPTQPEYRKMLEAFLKAKKVEALPEHRQQARRFLYYQLFRTSLPFDAYLESTKFRGHVRLKPFNWKVLLPAASPTVQTLLDGILNHGDLLLKE